MCNRHAALMVDVAHTHVLRKRHRWQQQRRRAGVTISVAITIASFSWSLQPKIGAYAYLPINLSQQQAMKTQPYGWGSQIASFHLAFHDKNPPCESQLLHLLPSFPPSFLPLPCGEELEVKSQNNKALRKRIPRSNAIPCCHFYALSESAAGKFRKSTFALLQQKVLCTSTIEFCKSPKQRFLIGYATFGSSARV